VSEYGRLWIGLVSVIVTSFAVLGYYGFEIYRQMPPVPEQVVTTDGHVVFTGDNIRDGQSTWQSMGGHQVGSVWGHGAYVAPDWTADWVHREATFILNSFSQAEHGSRFDELDEERRAALQARLQQQLRRNTYDPNTGTVTISQLRADAVAALSSYYSGLFADDPAREPE